MKDFVHFTLLVLIAITGILAMSFINRNLPERAKSVLMLQAVLLFIASLRYVL